MLLLLAAAAAARPQEAVVPAGWSPANATAGARHLLTNPTVVTLTNSWAPVVSARPPRPRTQSPPRGPLSPPRAPALSPARQLLWPCVYRVCVCV